MTVPLKARIRSSTRFFHVTLIRLPAALEILGPHSGLWPAFGLVVKHRFVLPACLSASILAWYYVLRIALISCDSS